MKPEERSRVGEIARSWFPVVLITIYRTVQSVQDVFVPLQYACVLSDLANYSEVFNFNYLF